MAARTSSFFKMKPVYVGYNDAYPSMFECEREQLFKAFGGDDYVLSIQHFGSSSVVGLGGKPIVDIWIALKSLPPSASQLAALSALSYEERPLDNADRSSYLRFDKVKSTEQSVVVTHCVHLSLNRRNSVVERFLNSEAGESWRHRYAQVKRDAATEGTLSMAEYRDAKTAFLQELRVAALQYDSQ
jgi:GrpB-like predicted nucleotidyltransferase (UPF0157 family)